MKSSRNIIERYSKETESASMGCANLNPWLEIKEGDIILDLGCGSGSQVFALHDRVGETGKIYGLDLTPEMIEKARQNNGFKNIFFDVGDIGDLPYDDNCFDLVLSNCVINHADDKKMVYNEIFRILKPGGYFLVGDVTAVKRLPDEVSNDPQAIADCYGGAIPRLEYIEIIGSCGFGQPTVLHSRSYSKKGFQLESITIKGVKP